MISVSDIHKAYGSVEVLRGISFDVAPAEVLSIVGPSGAGKTTLLQIMGTLEAPSAGSVTFDGTDVTRMGAGALARWRQRGVGFVFQMHRLLPEFSLIENVALPAMIAGLSRRRALDKARPLLDMMGLADRLTHRPSQLSGGECQRGAVARALVNEPRLVLADEPSGSLDTRHRQELHALFFDLRRRLGQTFVIVTHDETLAAQCDRTVHMADGLITSITSNPSHL